MSTQTLENEKDTSPKHIESNQCEMPVEPKKSALFDFVKDISPGILSLMTAGASLIEAGSSFLSAYVTMIKVVYIYGLLWCVFSIIVRTDPIAFPVMWLMANAFVFGVYFLQSILHWLRVILLIIKAFSESYREVYLNEK